MNTIRTDYQKEELISICRDLIRIPSENPPGNENGVVAYCDHFLKMIGADTRLISHTPARSSLLARWPGERNGKEILFIGHADTVPCGDTANWQVGPFSAEIRDKKIYGRGASDMKGGIAALLMALKQCTVKNSKNTIVLAITADEESDGLGATALMDPQWGLSPHLIIIPEPTHNQIAIAEKGTLWLEIVAHGKSAHASMPALGSNAVAAIAKMIETIDLSKYKEKNHPLLGKFTASFTTIQGGEKINIIPDRCSAKMDIRFLPGQDGSEILRCIETQTQSIARGETEVSVELIPLAQRAAIETDQSLLVMREMIAGIKKIKPDAKTIGVSYFTDAAALVPYFQAPFLICGPGNPQLAHTANEHIEVEKLFESYRIYNALLEALSKKENLP